MVTADKLDELQLEPEVPELDLSWLNLDTEWGVSGRTWPQGHDPAADQQVSVRRHSCDVGRQLSPAARGCSARGRRAANDALGAGRRD